MVVFGTSFLVGVVIALLTDQAAASSYRDEEWELFKRSFNKTYSKDTEHYRRAIWETNMVLIEKHNYEADLGNHTYRLGVNSFADLSDKEISQFHLGAIGNADANVNESKEFLPPNNVIIPPSVDWRTKGYVTPVKNQGNCGSCWAFSATGALEGQHFRKTGKLVSLSEQNLVDCAKTSYGCKGGWPSKAFMYVKQNGGIDTEISYPYKGKEQICSYKSASAGATCTGYVAIPPRNEIALQQAVASVGPVSVMIDANTKFTHYTSGIYDDPSCSSLTYNHAVLVVGYGNDQGEDFWLVKNSWGTSWGEQGYIRIVRKKNMCGIASHATYPTV